MLSDLSKLTMLEKRLTALEREVEDLKQNRNALDLSASVPDRVIVRCDEPGLLAAQSYEVEKFRGGKTACWLGSSKAVQLTIPVAPLRTFLCRLNIRPFHRVTLSDLRLQINNVLADHTIEVLPDDTRRVSFYGEARNLPFINIVFEGVNSVRPKDFGDSEDIRLLAFQFFGAEIDFIIPKDTGV